ncbi:beta family protein [Sphingopyxis sp. RIFCSPHIGHO2_12_FULL_65_19]|uniref:beta family protein n=1 Tax=Sphingopyxis sp. RIFCSPHIGHO2_12_FULL_65_19 TaxID=1802172 RepID=UPI0025FB674C|nr:hypothetical protein [Sphingopyxis sp. RIFCSPHIGHO2_12_FULL_65_19]
MNHQKPIYAPALRMKAGELIGVGDLAADIAGRILPRMIVPPPNERDDALQTKIPMAEPVPDISHALAPVWSKKPVLIDSGYLLDEFGRDRMSSWLPHMFERARKADVWAIPSASLSDLGALEIAAFKDALNDDAAIKFGLTVSSSDLADRAGLQRAVDVLEQLDIDAAQCVVTVDFHDADLSQPDFVAPIIGAALDDLQALALWQSIVFQGTNYPEKNPADPNGHYIVPRTEWLAWKRAVNFDPTTAEHMMFGDYAADCSKLSFGGGGGMAIRHIRYATEDGWLVQRGPNTGSHGSAMRKVCEAIVSSGKFAGQDFSKADEQIYRCSKGVASLGTAKVWRGINTCHHITRVVRDIGNIKGFEFEKRAPAPVELQDELFNR